MNKFTAVVLHPDYAVDACGGDIAVSVQISVSLCPPGLTLVQTAGALARQQVMAYFGYDPEEYDIDDWVVACLYRGLHDNLALTFD